MTWAHDRGSSTVEFVGVGALVTLCALGVIQGGVVAHVLAVATDSAITGAAYAALADSDLGAGASRARELATAALSPELIRSVTAARDIVSGRSVAVVTIRVRVPAFALILPVVETEVTGRAFLESP